jgi:ABC-type branched-subunit amino acid transport system permease subunit
MDQSTSVVATAELGSTARRPASRSYRRPPAWATTFVMSAAAIALGMALDDYQVGNLSYFLDWTFMAFGLCLMWGYAGILSFGQTAFFGLAGYAYAVFTTNFGASASSTLLGLCVALMLAALFAAILGYFMFYGGVTGVFVSIITLATTLVFETFLAQTAGPEWTIGKARLNGFNGMTGMPPLSVPWIGEDITLDGRSLYLVLVILVAGTYFALQRVIASRFGRAIVAIRENATRAELLGFNVRFHQLAAFVLGSALAGLSGVFYVTWGQYITPESMNLYATALPVVWVTVGGRRSLSATLIGTIGVLYVSQNLAIYGNQFALVLLGAVLLAAVMLSPQGFVAGALTWLGTLRLRRTELREAAGSARSVDKG